MPPFNTHWLLPGSKMAAKMAASDKGVQIIHEKMQYIIHITYIRSETNILGPSYATRNLIVHHHQVYLERSEQYWYRSVQSIDYRATNSEVPVFCNHTVSHSRFYNHTIPALIAFLVQWDFPNLLVLGKYHSASNTILVDEEYYLAIVVQCDTSGRSVVWLLHLLVVAIPA